jgi:hypothetical protein
MRIAIALLLVGVFPTSAGAGFADFNHYAQSESFVAGEIFQSGDLSFKAVNWLAILTLMHVGRRALMR